MDGIKEIAGSFDETAGIRIREVVDGWDGRYQKQSGDDEAAEQCDSIVPSRFKRGDIVRDALHSTAPHS